MKQTVIFLAMVACVTGALQVNSAFGESGMEACLGNPEMCIDTSRIKETVILDDRTVLFVMSGGRLFINRLPFQCTGLGIADGFAYTTSISKICKQDIITALWPDIVSGSRCGLGGFWPVSYDGDPREAIKLLKGGLLEKLVAEGAFETAPAENR